MVRPSHHVNDSRTAFTNPWPSALPPTWTELASMSLPFSWYPKEAQVERPPVKVVAPDWGASKLKNQRAKDYVVGTWLGHAGVLVEFKPLSSTSKGDSLYALFDPIFSMRAGPTQYTGPARFNEPPCGISDFPGCDVVCISHSHFDHLDTSTVLQIIQYFPSSTWFVPLGLQAWLVATGVKVENVKEMDWWDTWDGFPSKKLSGKTSSWFKFSCVPAQHNSGRGAFDQGSTLWCGWVLERFVESAEGKTRSGAVYHAGDTGYRRSATSKEVCPVFKEIGSKFKGFDLSFIPIWRGGTLGFISYVGLRLHHHEIPSQFHCSPADAVLIHKDIKSRNTIGIHFGTFVGSQNESDEASKEFYTAIKDEGVQTLNTRNSDRNGRAGAIDIGESFLIELD